MALNMGHEFSMFYLGKIASILCITLILPGILATDIKADELSGKILTLRERATVKDQLLEERLDTIIPEIMRREGIDAWVLIAREYNEDPVLKTMLPADGRY